jgi:hypothetical protein
VIERLTAKVKLDGRINVEGRDLVLGGGPSIGTSGGQSARATLLWRRAARYADPRSAPPNTRAITSSILSPGRSPIDCPSVISPIACRPS